MGGASPFSESAGQRDPALKGDGDRYRFAKFDLGDSAAIDRLLAPAFEDLKARQPASVCLVNNAASVGSIGILGRLAADEITSALATNLTAAVALANGEEHEATSKHNE